LMNTISVTASGNDFNAIAHCAPPGPVVGKFTSVPLLPLLGVAGVSPLVKR